MKTAQYVIDSLERRSDTMNAIGPPSYQQGALSGPTIWLVWPYRKQAQAGKPWLHTSLFPVCVEISEGNWESLSCCQPAEKGSSTEADKNLGYWK
jgi:hypothetical protein